jgi:hypothetical protein
MIRKGDFEIVEILLNDRADLFLRHDREVIDVSQPEVRLFLQSRQLLFVISMVHEAESIP